MKGLDINGSNIINGEDELIYKTIEIEKLQNIIQTLESHLNIQSFVITRLMSSDELRNSAEEVLKTLKRKLKGINEIVILLYDENIGGLCVFASAGLSKVKRKAIFHPGEGISGRSFLYKKVIFTEKAGNDPRFLGWFKGKSEYLNKAFISIPLQVGRDVVGVLTATGDVIPPLYQNLLKILAQTISPLIQLMKTKWEQERQYYSMIEKLIDISESFSPTWRGHSYRVNKYSIYIADKMKMKEKDKKIIEHGSRLHDVGKLAIMDIVKKRGKLSARDLEILKLHPLLGEQFVKDFDFLHPAIPIIKFHHERYDGTGYPGYYAKENIPLHARIVSVADVYDAITGPRHYRKSLNFNDALAEMKRSAGTQLDPALVEVFLENSKELKEFTLDLLKEKLPF